MKRILLLFFLLSLSLPVFAEKIRIWDGTSVAAPDVVMTPFLPDRPVGAKPVPAVIVCPGGSYFWLDTEREGRMVAQWLQEQGFAAFLLEYRTGGWFNYTFHTHFLFSGHHYPEMLEDIQRAIQLVREMPLHTA